VPRPPRENLLPHLAKLLDVPEGSDLTAAARQLLADRVRVPRGIALPFSLQQRFLESSPRIQQAIGKLKMALELNAREVEPLCLELQRLIRVTKVPDHMLHDIDTALVSQLAGVRAFVVRSSSNAEDLAGFSAAGIYESINHVTSAEKIVKSIKEVWASLVSARSVRLRQQAGISLDDCYMGVAIQEQVAAKFGGVLVTTNPMNRNDFRNVYVNVSPKVTDVVDGSTLPMQYLYSTVEGGGRTVSLGDATEDLGSAAKDQLQRLAIVGRLLQSHFSPDYTFDSPVDVEWLADDEHLFIVQLRPYSI
jgi:phosphoenolpyruvate synthase/pyruvate phosphate dikinase